MSEDKAIYGSIATDISDLVNAQCALPLSDPQYISPSPEQVKLLRNYLGLSQAKLGYFLRMPVDRKGCSMVRKWETPRDKKEHRKMDDNAWRRMLYAANLANPMDDLRYIK